MQSIQECPIVVDTFLCSELTGTSTANNESSVGTAGTATTSGPVRYRSVFRIPRLARHHTGSAPGKVTTQEGHKLGKAARAWVGNLRTGRVSIVCVDSVCHTVVITTQCGPSSMSTLDALRSASFKVPTNGLIGCHEILGPVRVSAQRAAISARSCACFVCSFVYTGIVFF
jgi:hypothetical protein